MALPHEIRLVDFAKRLEDAELMTASSTGSLPGLSDGHVRLMESCAILEYLGAKCRAHAAAPTQRGMSKAQPLSRDL